MVRHVGLVLLTFMVLQIMRRSVEESVGSVEECWQLELMRARRRISSSAPQGSSTSSTCHRVSPVNEKYQNFQQNQIRQAVLPV